MLFVTTCNYIHAQGSFTHVLLPEKEKLRRFIRYIYTESQYIFVFENISVFIKNLQSSLTILIEQITLAMKYLRKSITLS